MNNPSRPLALIAFCLLLASCGKAPPEKAKKRPVPSVKVEAVMPRVFTRTLPLTGSVEPAQVATLSSPAEGPVAECSVREGDVVEEGQVLLNIGRDLSATAAVEAAREELDRRQREFTRVETLVNDNALPGEQLDTARSELERARAALAQAMQVSADYAVTAPWAGVVSRLHVADGKYVSPRAALIDLFDPSSLVLRFQAPEAFANKIAVDQKLTARFDALPKQEFDLRVIRAYPELDRRLRMRTFEAGLPLDSQAFRPGFFARIEMSLHSEPKALTVPVEAVVNTRELQGTLWVLEEGKAMAREVLLGFEQDGRVWVREGLQAGDKVIVEGMEGLRDGQTVRVAGKNKSREN